MLAILGDCLLDVFGGAVAAGIMACGAWYVFRCLRWPEFGPWAVIVAFVLAPGAVQRSFVQMMLFFLVLIGVGLIPAGRAWRRRDRLYRIFHTHNVRAMQRNLPGRHPPHHIV
jgi:hypothetical protein